MPLQRSQKLPGHLIVVFIAVMVSYKWTVICWASGDLNYFGTMGLFSMNLFFAVQERTGFKHRMLCFDYICHRNNKPDRVRVAKQSCVKIFGVSQYQIWQKWNYLKNDSEKQKSLTQLFGCQQTLPPPHQHDLRRSGFMQFIL